MSLEKDLQKFFGFTSFREVQHKIIKGALKNYDQLVILPTGSGKSICYQLPGLIQDGYTIIVSPLMSLIKDQITNLEKKGINAVGIYSGTTEKQKTIIYSKILQNKADFKLIYTTPESIDTNISFINCIMHMKTNNLLNRFVIDEAHCISMWGNDFRSSYRKLSQLKSNFPGIPVMALTATATLQVRKDIVHNLQFKKYRQYTKSYFRSNLKIKIFNKINKATTQTQILEFCSQFKGETGIIYCNSRKKCEQLAEFINTNRTHSDISCAHYHAGMTNKNRTEIENDWKSNRVNIIVATVAFGMGIDKSDVRFVIHNNLPTSMENYYQEIGRGGRDDQPCYCILFYSYQDKIISEKMIRSDPSYMKNQKYIQHQLDKLNSLCGFCENIYDCRHCQLSNYLGEIRDNQTQQCTNSCDNCIDRDKYEFSDVSDIAREIINAIMVSGNRCYKSNIKKIFMQSHMYGFLKNKYSGTKGLMELYNRLVVHLIINKFIKEELEINDYGFWNENLKLYKKAKSLLDKIEHITLLIKK
jgi:RecQ family ATP-dependent DNA helicase